MKIDNFVNLLISTIVFVVMNTIINEVYGFEICVIVSLAEILGATYVILKNIEV